MRPRTTWGSGQDRIRRPTLVHCRSRTEFDCTATAPARHRWLGSRPALDRAVVDRVRATLRRAMDRVELPDIPLLCAEEVDRSCAPWGLLAEDKQAALVAGIEMAVGLAPLRDRRCRDTHSAGRSRPACVRRPTSCMRGDTWLVASRCIPGNARSSTSSPRSYARTPADCGHVCMGATCGRNRAPTWMTSGPCSRAWPAR